MNQIVCPSCGAENPPGFRFCGACGVVLERACASCGALVSAGFRFCGSCGAPVDEGRAPAAGARPLSLEERKLVTVLFADLAASTEMASRLDPEDLRAVLRPFFDAMVEEIERLGGTVEKFIGDAIVAVFGVPAAHEDDPVRAVRAAIAMHARLRDLNAELSATAGDDLAIRIGVNTGEVVAAHAGDHEGFVTGEAVNVASRLQSLAAPGTVVVGDRTYRDTRESFGYRSLGERSVKGIDRPLAAWELVPEARPSGGAGGLRSTMVGRADEMELLRLLFARVEKAGRPHLVTVVGPAGIGKSRLAHEFATRVSAPGTAASVADGADRGSRARIVRGRCLSYGEGLAYWPLAEILKADAGILDSDRAESILEKARARLDPRFAGDDGGLGATQVLLSSIGVTLASDPLAGVEPAAASRLIEGAWRRYVESIAAERPVVALIEDLHWADPGLLDLLESVATRVRGPLFLLCTARPDLSESRPAWGGGLANATNIALSPLTAGEGATLIDSLLDGGAPSEVVDAVLHRAEGNPFFTGELLRMMTEDGSLERRGRQWALTRPLPTSLPDTVQGVIASRIDLLTPAEKRSIQDAAVVGRVFWRGAVDQLGSADAGAAMDALVEKGIIWERESSAIADERELIFNHILTRDVAYNSIPRSRRADAHAAVLRWIEEVTSGRDEEFAEILAHHASLAGDLQRTSRYAMLAGHRHRRVFAAEDAIRWYDRALEAASELPVEASTLLVAESALSRGEACEQLGRFAEAHAGYERAIEASRAGGRGREWLEARSVAALAHVLWMEDRYEESEQMVPEALALARATGSGDLEARMLYTLGTIAFGSARFRDSLAYQEDALRVAEAHHDLEGEALARHGLTESRFFVGPFREGLTQGLRADELLRDLGQRPMVHHNEYMVALLRWAIGEVDEALKVARAAVDGCREVGNRRDEGYALGALAMMSLSRGELGVAARIADDGVEVALAVGAPRLELVARGWRLFVLSELQAFDEIAEDSARALAISDSLVGTFYRPVALPFRGWVQERRGDIEAARASFEEATSASRDSRTHLMLSSRAEILCREELRDPDDLSRAGARLLEAAGEESPSFRAWASYALALAASIDGDAPRTVQRAEEAFALAERIEAPVVWRARGLLGRSLGLLGREDEARKHLDEASAMLRAMADEVKGPKRRACFLARPDVSQILRIAGV